MVLSTSSTSSTSGPRRSGGILRVSASTVAFCSRPASCWTTQPISPRTVRRSRTRTTGGGASFTIECAPWSSRPPPCQAGRVPPLVERRVTGGRRVCVSTLKTAHADDVVVHAGGPRPVPRLVCEFADVVVAISVFAAASLLRRWHPRYGATDPDVEAAIPGDDLVPGWQHGRTRAITIDASAGGAVAMAGTGGIWHSGVLLEPCRPGITAVVVMPRRRSTRARRPRWACAPM